jgi:molybdopterin molybdotransferase
MGAHFHFTGVRIQPGKPLVFGEMPRNHEATKQANHKSEVRSNIAVRTLPFFGLPGNPVSSAVTFLLFAAPVLTALAGGNEPGPRFVLARLASKSEKLTKAGLTRFLPAKYTFGIGGELPEVSVVPWQGSGDLAAMALSNCFLVVPEDSGELQPGEAVRILLS